MERRRFLTALTVGASGLLGVLVSIPLVGHLFAPLTRKASGADAPIDLGPVSDFPVGQPVRVAFPVRIEDGWAVTEGERSAWVVRNGSDQVHVFTTTCPHLGCSVEWAPKRDEFSCPCHDSGFGKDGAKLHGPSRRGLDALPVEVKADRLVVRHVEYVPGIADKRRLDGRDA
ncbi:MAG: Rieske (2Fe-2S) protein [Acidobacteriota bacterium]